MAKKKENFPMKSIRETVEPPVLREAAVALLIAVGKKVAQNVVGGRRP